MNGEVKSHIFSIPNEVSRVPLTLTKAGYKAYLVGGCVRDILLGKQPKDWDVATNATPEQIIALFPKTFYENSFGTVGVVNEDVSDETSKLKVIEVTPFRLEAEYSDKRRPDSVIFSQNLEDDLKRRDFTINAIALELKEDLGGGKFSCETSDPYDGLGDMKRGIIKTVGKPDDRFAEDALRMLRAIRISCEHNLTIEAETLAAIAKNSELLSHISAERIRDEFVRVIESKEPMKGIVLAQKLGILKFIAPELEQAIGIEQTQTHKYDVWEHLLRTLQHAADKEYPTYVRLAALFHDIGKPATRQRNEEHKEWTFYGHEVAGAKMTRKIMSNLKFSKDLTEKVVKLVRWHMFFSDTEQISLSAVRRMIANVGKEHIWDLMNVRICDRIGTGRPKEDPYRLRKYKAMVEEALRDPLTVGMLKVDGNSLIKGLGITPGPKIGLILHALLNEVLENPAQNTEEYLMQRAKDLLKLPDDELQKLGDQGKERREEEEEKTIEEIRKKYWVK